MNEIKAVKTKTIPVTLKFKRKDGSNIEFKAVKCVKE